MTAVTWSPTVIQTLHGSGQQKNIEAWSSPAAPGLAIHLGLDSWKLSTWTITHVSTGRSVLKALPNQSAAESAAIALAREADWSGSLAELTASAVGLRMIIDAVAGKHGGHQ